MISSKEGKERKRASMKFSENSKMLVELFLEVQAAPTALRLRHISRVPEIQPCLFSLINTLYNIIQNLLKSCFESMHQVFMLVSCYLKWHLHFFWFVFDCVCLQMSSCDPTLLLHLFVCFLSFNEKSWFHHLIMLLLQSSHKEAVLYCIPYESGEV